MKIEKDGYVISQAEKNHIMICKNGEMLMHISSSKKCETKEELLEHLELYFKLVEKSGGLDE